MVDDDPSVLTALGIDLADDYPIPDSVWGAALDAAFDPDTHVADAALVPEMDDHDDVIVDTIADDAAVHHHPAADHAIGDHPTADHATDADSNPHNDAQVDLHTHDVDDHLPAGHDHHSDHPTDHDWHG